MSNRSFIATLLASGLVLCAAAPAADAYPHHGWYRPGPVAWRGGFWRHSWYGGRYGWWWVVGGVWYFYPQPIYPNPDLYVPPDYQAAQAAPAGAPPPQVWYYCDAAKAYYPYVSSCTSAWRPVPSTPPPAAAPTPPPPVPAAQAPATPPPTAQAPTPQPPVIPPASTPPV